MIKVLIRRLFEKNVLYAYAYAYYITSMYSVWQKYLPHIKLSIEEN